MDLWYKFVYRGSKTAVQKESETGYDYRNRVYFEGGF